MEAGSPDHRIVLAPLLLAMFSALVSAQEARQQRPTARTASTEPFQRVGQVDGDLCLEQTPFSADGSAFVTKLGETARVWDARTLRPLSKPLRCPGLAFYRLTADGRTVFTAGGKDVCIWDVATSQPRSTVNAARGKLFFGEISPDGKRFVTVDSAAIDTAAVWLLGDAQPALLLRHDAPLNSAEFDPTSTWIVTHAFQQAFHVWSADSGREVCPPLKSDDKSIATHLAQFDATGTRLAVPQRERITIIEPTGRLLLQVQFEDEVYAERVRFGARATKLAVMTSRPLYPGPVRIFDVATGKVQRELASRVIDCQIDPGGRWALCTPIRSTPADLPELWDLASGTKVQTFPQETGGEVMSPDGSLILVQRKWGITDAWRLKLSGE